MLHPASNKLHLHHQQQYLLQLPGDGNGAHRRGSAESAYYSTCSGEQQQHLDGADRRASWQAGDALDEEMELDANRHTCDSKHLSTSDSVLCAACERRKFLPMPADRSPFHTRAHEEVVMKEFARLCDGSDNGRRPTAAASATVVPAADTVAPAVISEACGGYLSLEPQIITTSPNALPPLPEELPDGSSSSNCCSIAAWNSINVSSSDGLDSGGRLAQVGLAGRLNTLASCDLRRPRLMATTVSSVQPAASDRESPGTKMFSGRRKLSLDAPRGFQFASITPASTPHRHHHAALFRLFHQESTPEELLSFANSRKLAATSDAADKHQNPEQPQQHQQQQPSRLFRRFQSTDDDYPVALKVEDPEPDVFLAAAPQDREKLLTVSADGQTVVTELSSPPTPPPPPLAVAAAAGQSPKASLSPSSSHDNASESEIEAALRLAKTSRFAYVPPKRLVENSPDCKYLNHGRRDADWRRCVVEMSSSPVANSTKLDGGSGIGCGGSRVKRLMAKFNGEAARSSH